jgi:hypothetical protein
MLPRDGGALSAPIAERSIWLSSILLKTRDLVPPPASDAGGATPMTCRLWKMSHEIGPTEIERYFNCHSIRSDLLSSQHRCATKKIF